MRAKIILIVFMMLFVMAQLVAADGKVIHLHDDETVFVNCSTGLIDAHEWDGMVTIHCHNK